MGGLANSRTGGGNSTNIGEPISRGITKFFSAVGQAAVSPYENSTSFVIDDGYIRAPGTNYPILAAKDVRYEPGDFKIYDGGDNLAGVLQKN